MFPSVVLPGSRGNNIANVLPRTVSPALLNETEANDRFPASWTATMTDRFWPISARKEQLRSDTGCQIKSWLRMQLWQLSRRGLTSWHHHWSAARVARAFPLPSAALGTYRGPSRDEGCADDRKNGGKYMCTARTRSTPKAAIGVPHRRGSVGRATP